MSQTAHRNQHLCQDLFLVLCLGSWGAPISIKKWLRGQRRRREFGTLKSHLSLFSSWTQRFSGRCPSYICVCSCPVPLTMLSPIPTTPALERERQGRSPAKASTGRTAAGAAGSDARVFCTVFLCHIQPFTAVCSKAHLPLLLWLSISASLLLAPSSRCLASPLLAGPTSLVPFPPPSPCCLLCLFWT